MTAGKVGQDRLARVAWLRDEASCAERDVQQLVSALRIWRERGRREADPVVWPDRTHDGQRDRATGTADVDRSVL